jgi:hypothetical protein
VYVLAGRYDAFTFRGRGRKSIFVWNPEAGRRVDVGEVLKLFEPSPSEPTRVRAYEEQALRPGRAAGLTESFVDRR